MGVREEGMWCSMAPPYSLVFQPPLCITTAYSFRRVSPMFHRHVGSGKENWRAKTSFKYGSSAESPFYLVQSSRVPKPRFRSSDLGCGARSNSGVSFSSPQRHPHKPRAQAPSSHAHVLQHSPDPKVLHSAPRERVVRPPSLNTATSCISCAATRTVSRRYPLSMTSIPCSTDTSQDTVHVIVRGELIEVRVSAFILPDNHRYTEHPWSRTCVGMCRLRGDDAVFIHDIVKRGRFDTIYPSSPTAMIASYFNPTGINR
ncbi:hypothetical protein BV22DRAFT_642357 [Leucogyrophana mollusca]|uniref:Uncharacterized protein n=1 Tax=Leucogyrophana mollusca TaxID=85980 RepID=A0ACB8BAB3_9AGAM|nr:hypothetical protein BV22DRAFT_642357 [Leucogyrophana mollusca]